jgi:transcriptional regulator with XRE-family HTH domain
MSMQSARIEEFIPFRAERKPLPADIHVGAKLRFARNSKGLSQEQLALKMGLTFQQIQKYEKGTNRIGASRLWQFCKILGVDANYFFDGLDRDGFPTSEGPDHMVMLKKPGAPALLSNFSKLETSVSRRALTDMARRLVEIEGGIAEDKE